jgi:hypothetical protein
MTINPIEKVFALYIAAVAAVASTVLVIRPSIADGAVKPVIWILIAMAIFEIGAFAKGRGAPGTMLSTPARFFGFVGAFALVGAVVWLAGLNVSLV